MREIIDREMLLLLEGLFEALTSTLSPFLSHAQALCAIFMLLYFGLRSYGMLSGDQPLEIMPMLRPFGLAMVIIFWPQFIDVLTTPTSVIADTAKGMLTDRIDELDAIQVERQEKLAQVSQRLIEQSAEIEQFANADQEESWMETLGIDFSAIFDQLKGYYVLIQAKSRWLLTEIIEFLIVTFYQAASYLIFFLQVVFAAILVLLGPFSFAVSILPGFRDAYLHWIARFISVSLYGGIGYMVMSLSMLVIRYGLEKELVMLEYILADDTAFMAYVTVSGASGNIYIAGLLIGGFSMLTIPLISTWIVQTSGVGGALSTAFRSIYTTRRIFR